MYHLAFNPAFSVLPYETVHKGCGGRVEQTEWMRRFMPEWHTCPRCSTLLHRNNVERRPMVVA